MTTSKRQERNRIVCSAAERSSGMCSTLVYCTKFSKVSALVYLLFRITIQRTFENFGLQLTHTFEQRTAKALGAKAAKLRYAKVSKETYKRPTKEQHRPTDTTGIPEPRQRGSGRESQARRRRAPVSLSAGLARARGSLCLGRS